MEALADPMHTVREATLATIGAATSEINHDASRFYGAKDALADELGCGIVLRLGDSGWNVRVEAVKCLEGLTALAVENLDALVSPTMYIVIIALYGLYR